MKASMYNVILDYDNKKLLYNSYSNAFAELDGVSYSQYFNMDIKDKALYEKLVKGKYIVDDNLDEVAQYKIIKNISRFRSNILSLTITPTLNCNMNCPYCYETKKNVVMSKETCDELIDFIKRHIENNGTRYISICWYGGEPLLEIDMIAGLSEKINEICKNNKIQLNQSMVTNGYLLNSMTKEKLKSIKNLTYIQISLDGNRGTHNKTRKLKDGSGTFDVIINNIINACDDIKISIRVNVHKNNIAESFQLIDYLEKVGLKNKIMVYFSPIRDDTEQCAHVSPMCLSNEEFADVNNEIFRLAQEKGYKFPANSYPSLSILGCSAITPYSFVIDPEGNLNKCWNEVGLKDRRIGTLKSGQSLNEENKRWLSYEIPENCFNCSTLPICSGGCPYHRIRNVTQECNYKKYLLKNILKLVYDKYKKDKKCKEEVAIMGAK